MTLAQSVRRISKDFVDKWRVHLSETERRAIEATCARGMKWAGYDSLAEDLDIRLKGKLTAARMWFANVNRINTQKSVT